MSGTCHRRCDTKPRHSRLTPSGLLVRTTCPGNGSLPGEERHEKNMGARLKNPSDLFLHCPMGSIRLLSSWHTESIFMPRQHCHFKVIWSLHFALKYRDREAGTGLPRPKPLWAVIDFELMVFSSDLCKPSSNHSTRESHSEQESCDKLWTVFHGSKDSVVQL